MRERKLQDIAALSKQVAEEKELLDRRKRSLDSVTLKLKAQKQKLERDARNARTSIRQLSQKRRKRPSSAKYRRSSSSTWPSANCATDQGQQGGRSVLDKTTGLRLPSRRAA